MSEKTYVSDDGLPEVSIANFIDCDFEEKFKLYAQRFGLAGTELIKGVKMTNKDFDIPMAGDMVHVFWHVVDDRYIKLVESDMTNAAALDEEVLAVEKELKADYDATNDRRKSKIENKLYKDVEKEMYTLRLQNGLKRKDQYVANKQLLCSKLMMKLDQSLRVSVQQHKDKAKAIEESDIIKLFEIVKVCATGRGAQTTALKFFHLFQLEQKSENVIDFEVYARDFDYAVIDIMKIDNDAKVILEEMFNARFIFGLIRGGLFKEYLAGHLTKKKWPNYRDLIEELGRVVRTQRGFSDMSSGTRAQKKNSDGAIVADATRLLMNIPEELKNACFKCGKSNHRAMDCPEPDPYCGLCGKKAHHMEMLHHYLVRNNNSGGGGNNNKFSNNNNNRRNFNNNNANGSGKSGDIKPQNNSNQQGKYFKLVKGGRPGGTNHNNKMVSAKSANVEDVNDESREDMDEYYLQPVTLEDELHSNDMMDDDNNNFPEYGGASGGYVKTNCTTIVMCDSSDCPEESEIVVHPSIMCCKCQSTISKDDARNEDVLKIRIVADTGCVGSAHVVNDRKLFSVLKKLNTKQFTIQSYDGRIETVKMFGKVDGLGDCVLAENAPNCLMNVKKFCADYKCYYISDDQLMEFYERGTHRLIVTARDTGDGFYTFEYGELLFGQQEKTVVANAAEIHQQCYAAKAQGEHQHTAEELSRAREAQKLCSLMGHPGDKAILRALANGNFASNNLTTQDLLTCRKLWGPCHACLEAKMTAPHATPSDTPPARKIGEKVFCDIIFFREGCFGGYTCALFSVDEKSLFRVVVGLKSKAKDKLLEGFKTLIGTYTSHGHVVKHIIMDDEPVFNAMRQPLAELGILATVTPAGLHNRKCERYIQTHVGRERSIKADLPYELPPKLDYHLALWTVTMSNQVPNLQVQLTTPYELFTGKKPFVPLFKFGQTGVFYAARPDSDQKGEWGIFLGHRDNLINSFIGYVPLRDQFYSLRKFQPVETYPTEWNFKPRLRPPDSTKKSKQEQLSTLKQEIYKPLDLPKANPQPLATLESVAPPAPADPPMFPAVSTAPQPAVPMFSPTPPNAASVAPVPQIPAVVVAPEPVPPPVVAVVPTKQPKPKKVSAPAPAQEGVPAPPPVVAASAPASHHEGSSRPTSTSVSDAPVSPSKPINLDVKEENIVPVGSKRSTRGINPKYADDYYSGIARRKTGANSVAINNEEIAKHIARVEHLESIDDKIAIAKDWIGKGKAMAMIRINQMSVRAALKDASKLQLTKNAITGELRGLIDTKSLRPRKYQSLSAEEKEKNVVGTHMFIEDKYLSTGEFEKRKARLVIHGNQQDPSTIGETRAPTVNPITVNACLAAAASMKNCDIETADVVQAFLGTPYKEEDKKLRGRVIVRVDDQDVIGELLIQMPELREFVVESKGGRKAMFFELDTYVYGLAAAAREFNVVLNEVMTKKLGYRVSDADPCLYLKKTQFGIHYVCVHVDDLLSIAPNRQVQNAFMEAFGKHLKIKRHSGNILSYIGLTISKLSNGDIRVTQDHQVQELVKKFGNELQGKMVKTPAGNELVMNDTGDDAIKLSDQEKKLFLSLIMSLMYLARLTRSDILFATTYLATKSVSPTRGDLRKAKRIVKYISCTVSVGVTFKSQNNMELVVHADASHLLHPEGYGHTGFIVTVGGSIVFARSTKQKMQTLSSTESELIALQDASTIVVWMRYLLGDIGYPVSKPTIVTQDNQSATIIAEQGGNFQRTKHLVGRFNYLRERIVTGDLVIKYRPTDKMPADYLTKPVSDVLLQRHLRSINVW